MSLILLNEVGNLATDYEVQSVDLVDEYWQPDADGESKRMVFWAIQNRKCRDQQTGEEIQLECVVFIIPSNDGENHKAIVNGSKRLVGTFENSNLQQGTPVQVTYRGKKKNRTNANMSDHWSVVTLQKKGKK